MKRRHFLKAVLGLLGCGCTIKGESKPPPKKSLTFEVSDMVYDESEMRYMTPNEVRVIRGSEPFPTGGDDPLLLVNVE